MRAGLDRPAGAGAHRAAGLRRLRACERPLVQWRDLRLRRAGWWLGRLHGPGLRWCAGARLCSGGHRRRRDKRGLERLLGLAGLGRLRGHTDLTQLEGVVDGLGLLAVGLVVHSVIFPGC